MNERKIEDAIGFIDDELIENALSFNKKSAKREPFFTKLKNYKKLTRVAVAALLVLSITLGIFLTSGMGVMRSFAVSLPDYPVMPQRAVMGIAAEKSEAWREARSKQFQYYKDVGESLNSFYAKTISEYLGSQNGDNAIYSPTSAYLALAMLAECTNGSVKSELLSLLGVSSESLAETSEALWLSTYWDDGKTTTKLASSLWLDKDYEYDERITELLAEKYYASSFRGKFGTSSYNKALEAWLKKETGGLLKTDGIGFNPETILAIATSVYFEASWESEFTKAENGTYLFKSNNGSTSSDFLKITNQGVYYWGDKFSATKKEFRDGGGAMYFILPDEGISPEELMADSEAVEFISNGGKTENAVGIKVHLAVPRFDVETRADLSEMLSALGLNSLFAPTGDYAILGDDALAYVSKIIHDARVAIDEEGCIAAAYTVIVTDATSAAPPESEVYFTVDRPFIFMITSSVGAPIFVGIVNNI